MGSVMVWAPSRPSSLHTQSTENLPILRLGIFCFPIGSSCSSALATLVGLFVFVMPVKSSSSEDSSTSSETDSDWTRNDGSTSEEEEEIPANQSLRGMACLVTAACPRKYPRALKERRASRLVLPTQSNDIFNPKQTHRKPKLPKLKPKQTQSKTKPNPTQSKPKQTEANPK